MFARRSSRRTPHEARTALRPSRASLIRLVSSEEVQSGEAPKTSPFRGQSALRSGLLTGLSYVTLAASGAVAGVYLAHKFGRNDRTDGFMAAYGVYLVLVLGAQAFRMVVVPDLTRASAERRLGTGFADYALWFLLLGFPVRGLVLAFPGVFGTV